MSVFRRPSIAPFQRPGYLPGAPAAASITGALAVTLDAVTSSGAGAVAISGTGSATLGNVTSTAAGALALVGTGAATLAVVTASASGALAIAGTGAATLGALTVSARNTNYGFRFYGHVESDRSKVRIEVDNPANPPIDVGAGDFTYEFWMRAAYADNTSASIADARYSNIILDRDIWGHERGWVLGVTRRSGPILAVCWAAADTGGGWATTYGTSDVGDNVWHHIALTWRQSTRVLECYVDGVSQGTRTLTVSNLSYPDGERPGSGANNEYLVIGGEKHGVGVAYTGYLDELRVSNTRRYTAGFSRPTAPMVVDGDTVAYFGFDEGAGSSARDTSGQSGAENAELLVGGSPASPEWVELTDVFGNSGDLAVTLGALTSTATGTVAIAGAATVTLTDTTLTATGTVAITGAAAPTMANVALAATGALALQGQTSLTLENASLAAAGALLGTGTGSLTATLGALTASATGQLEIRAAAAPVLADATASSAGALALQASLAFTLGDVSAQAAGAVLITGSGTIALAILVVVAVGGEGGAVTTPTLRSPLSASLASDGRVRATLASPGATHAEYP